MISQHDALRFAIEGLEQRVGKNEREIQLSLSFLKEILFPPEKDVPEKPHKMGFIQDKRKV